MKSRFLFLFLIAGLMLISSTNVLACSCAFGGGAPCQEFWRADAVFAGTVVGSGKINVGEGEFKQEMRLVRMTVDQPIRGMQSAEVEVITGWGGGDCGYAFKLGRALPCLCLSGRNRQTTFHQHLYPHTQAQRSRR